MYAFVSDDELKEVRTLPNAARKLVGGKPKGDWVLNFRNAPKELQEACGYRPLTEDDKPDIKSNQYLERNLVIRYEKPVIEWKRRIKKLDDQIIDTKVALNQRDLSLVGDDLKVLEKSLTDPQQSLGQIRDVIQSLSRIVKLLAEERFPQDA